MRVSQISLFPFKSLKGISVKECEIDEHGFLYDRIYMLAHKDKHGKWNPLTQRTKPAMARISTSFVDSKKLLLKFQDLEVKLPLDITEFSDDLPKIDTELWGFPMQCCNVIDAIPGLKSFFFKFFQYSDINIKIEDTAVFISSTRRVIPQSCADKEVTSSFQDIWPGTLMTTASFDDLKRHVQFSDESATIDMDSFRMNLLIETDEAWIEDDWKRIQIAENEWHVLMTCERCTMPAIDQATGLVRKGKHPLPSLNKFRVLEKGKFPCFGLNIMCKNSGFFVKVGDEVRVLEQV